MKKPGRRQVTWTLVLLGLVALVVWALMPKPVEVDLATVDRGPLAVTVEEEGETRVRDRFVVSSPVAGRVLRIDLEPGDRVEAGQTVAVMEPAGPALLDVRSRAEAQAGAEAARAAQEGAEAELEQAEAARDLALSELRRTRRLAEEDIVSQERLEQAETEARQAGDAVRAARAAVATARQELAAARARLAPAGGGAAGDEPVTVESPVAGLVLRRLRESEAVVPAGEALLEVADPGDLEIVTDLLSRDAVRVDVGDPVRIEQWGGEEVLHGVVSRVEPAGFTKISALGVEEQRVNVVIDFADPQTAFAELGDAYRVELGIVVWQADDVLRVPTSALFRRPPGMEEEAAVVEGGETASGDAGAGPTGAEAAEAEGDDAEEVFRAAPAEDAPGPRSGEPRAVFVLENGRAVLRPVTVGRRTALQAQVLAGLQPGDQVVVYPSDILTDGTQVVRRE